MGEYGFDLISTGIDFLLGWELGCFLRFGIKQGAPKGKDPPSVHDSRQTVLLTLCEVEHLCWLQM
jgi:hypothetical protein